MRARLAALTAVAIGATLSASADAAPRKTCNLVKDTAGDVSNEVDAGVEAFPDDAGLDLAGADVASNAEDITVLIKLHAAPGDATAYAKRYIAEFRVAGLANPLVLAAAITPTGTVYNWGYYGQSSTGTIGYNYPGTATGSISGKVITITAPLEAIGDQDNLGVVKKNAKVSNIRVTANRRVPSLAQVSGQVFVADEALGGRSGIYYAAAPSCVKVGG